MAKTTGTTSSQELLDYLFSEGHNISFYQAVSLLEEVYADALPIGKEGPANHERIRIRPSVSLAHPASDIEIINSVGERVQITTTFLGLYGVDSPLPNAYPEHIVQIADDLNGARLRAFLDLFHHRLYSLLYRAWRKTRPRVDSRKAEASNVSILALAGISNPLNLGQHYPFCLSEARIFALKTRTVGGLEALLKNKLGYACHIHQLQKRSIRIPDDQRSQLGRENVKLGVSFVLGEQLFDCNEICVSIDAASFSMYERLLPEGEDRLALDQLLSNYLKDPIDYNVEIKIQNEHIRPGCLGQNGLLGRTLWLGIPRPSFVTHWKGQSSIAKI